MLSVQAREDTQNKTQQPQEKFDAIIVFGEGPIRPVLLASELTPQQQKIWQEFKANPHSRYRPDFWVIEEASYLDAFAVAKDKEAVRNEWQHTGHFALRRWGRQNALAAALALYEGITQTLILSGGKTKPRWVSESLPKERIKEWPSEALLMQDVIVRNFGKLYEKRYGRPIQDALCIEDASTNTLENFAYTINRNSTLLHEHTRIGLLSARHHLKRVAILAKLFSVTNTAKISAEEMLAKVKEEQLRKQCVSLVEKEQTTDEDIDELNKQEAQWTKGLEDPKYATYWFGYLGDVKHPHVIQQAMRRFADPEWEAIVSPVFGKIGISLHDFIDEDLEVLAKENPEKYGLLLDGLHRMKSAEFRILPPTIR